MSTSIMQQMLSAKFICVRILKRKEGSNDAQVQKSTSVYFYIQEMYNRQKAKQTKEKRTMHLFETIHVVVLD